LLSLCRESFLASMDFAAVFDEESPKQRSSRQHRGRRRKTLSPSRVTTFLSEVELQDDPMNFPDPPSLVEAAAAAARAAEAVMEAMDQFADSNDVAGLLDTPAAKQRYSLESSTATSPLPLAFATPSTSETGFTVSSSSGQRSGSASARQTPASGARRSVLGVLHSSGGNIVVATPAPLSKAVNVNSTSASSSSSSNTKRQTALQENRSATPSTHVSPATDSTAEIAAVAQKSLSPRATTAAQIATISPIALAGTSPGGFFAGDDTAVVALPQGRSQRGGRRNRRQSFVLPPEAEMLQSVDDAAAAEAANATNAQEPPTAAAAAADTAAATAEQPPAAASAAVVAPQPQGSLPTATDGFLVAPALQQGWGSAVELSRNSSDSSSSDNDLRALTRAFAAAPAGSQRARRAAARVYCLTGYPLAAMAARDAAELCSAAAAAQTHPLSWSPYDSPVHDSTSNTAAAQFRLRGAVVSVAGPSKDGKRALVRRLAPVLEAMEQRGSSEKRATEAATGLVCQRGEGRDDGYQYCELRQRAGRSPASTAVPYAVYVQRYLEHVESIKLERQADFAAALGDAQLLQPVAAVDNSSSTAVVDGAAAADGESVEEAAVAAVCEEAAVMEMVAVAADAHMVGASTVAVQQYTETVTETAVVFVAEGEAVQEQQEQHLQPTIEHAVDVAPKQREEQEAVSPVRAVEDGVTASTSAAASDQSPDMSVLAASPSLVPRRPLTPPKTFSPRRCSIVTNRSSSDNDNSYSKDESAIQSTAVEAVTGSAAAVEYNEDTDMDIEGSSSSSSASSDELNSSGSSSSSSAVDTEASASVTVHEDSSEFDAAAVLLAAADEVLQADNSSDDDKMDEQQQLAEAAAMADSSDGQLMLSTTTSAAASGSTSVDAISGSVPAVAVAALEAEHTAAVAAAEAKLWAVWEAALQVHHTEVAAAEEALAVGMAQLHSAAAAATNVAADSVMEVSTASSATATAVTVSDDVVLNTSSSAMDSEVEAVAVVVEEEAAGVSSSAAVSEVDISMDLWDSEEINSSFAASASQQQQFDTITADDSVCLGAADSALQLSTGTAHTTAAAAEVLAAVAVAGGGSASTCELCCNGAACVVLQPCEHELCARCMRKLQRHCEQSGGVLRCPWDRQAVTRLDTATSSTTAAYVNSGIGSSDDAAGSGVQDSSTELDSSSASSSSY
jgi:hypothetical protein